MTGPIWVLSDERYLRQRMPASLLEWLERRGCDVRLVVADRGPLVSALAGLAPPDIEAAWDGLAPRDLVVVRSRHPFALALLHEAEARGARTLPNAESVLRVRNKVRAALALSARGIPVPQTLLARRPSDLRGVAPESFPLLLKPFQGDNAHGITIVHSEASLEEVNWPEQLLVAQPYVDAGGVDLKLYVVGGRVWAVRRRSPLVGGEGVEPVTVTSDLRDLALACAAAFDLPLAGIDVLEAPAGPLVVDVNEFPNYSGVEEAPDAIGSLLLGFAAASRAREADGAAVR